MHRLVIKALLHPEFHRRYDIEKVRLRRNHRTTSLRRRQSICSSTDLSRPQTGSNDGGDTSASSIDFVKQFQHEQSKQSSGSDNTFVDNGPGAAVDCTREIFASFERERANQLGRVPVIRDSDGSIIFTHAVEDCDIGSRDSLQYYSKPVRVVIDRRQTTTVNSVIHTTTAQMIIGSKDKEDTSPMNKGSPSNESEISNYNERSLRVNMACEDLVNMDTSMKNKGTKMELNQKCPTIDERHSMPTLFVGNRFNCSSLTEVFIPSYREKLDLKYPDASEKSYDENRHSNISTATHSSSIDIAPVMPAPDQLSAEILYNPSGTSPDTSSRYLIKPPSMFGANKTLSKEIKSHLASLEDLNRNEMKRCTSSQMIHLQNELSDAQTKSNDKFSNMKKCGCCTQSPCVSQRSSDSGMAGSYTIQLTPETPVPNASINAFDHDAQFIPDIEQRLNGLMHSQSSHSFGNFDNIPFADSNHDSGQYGCNEESESEQNRNSAAAKNMSELSSSQDTVRRKSRCQSVEPGKDEETESHAMYKTGLYAHWWKKAQLPPGMLNDIIRMKMKRQSADDSTESRGSGKIRCFLFRRVLLTGVVVCCARTSLIHFASFKLLFFLLDSSIIHYHLQKIISESESYTKLYTMYRICY